jgi:hypothetical protein
MEIMPKEQIGVLSGVSRFARKNQYWYLTQMPEKQLSQSASR